MILFNEVKRLSETSEAAFTHFYNIMSRKDSGGKDILYICSTAKMADEVFAGIAKDYLDGEIHKNKRYLKTTDGIGIWVHPIMMLPPWLPGHKFYLRGDTMEIGIEGIEELEPTVQELKDHIKACMRKEATPIQVYYGGRGSGRTYKLLAAMEECLRELAETNKALVSNQKAMAETTDALLKRINAALKELEFGNVDKAKSILWDGLNGESDS